MKTELEVDQQRNQVSVGDEGRLTPHKVVCMREDIQTTNEAMIAELVNCVHYVYYFHIAPPLNNVVMAV